MIAINHFELGMHCNFYNTDAEGMARKIIPVELSSALFHYDRNQHYELLELKVGVAR